MAKIKLAWRFRKGSESNPILTKDCGCKYYVYDGTIVRYCDEHNPNKDKASIPYEGFGNIIPSSENSHYQNLKQKYMKDLPHNV